MALLTAEDILNKAFETVKFREGYDIDQVDDFLDEVVKTVTALQSENDDLRSRLAAAEGRVAELSREGAQSAETSAPPAPVNDAENDELRAKLAAATQQIAQLSAVNSSLQAQARQLQAQVTQAAQASQAPVPQTSPTPAVSGPDSAAGMLHLAQKLHDDYVRSGQEEGDRLVSEAKAEAARIIAEAQGTSERILNKLEQEKSLLERKIDELRLFERDYRTRLKSYLQNLLTDLDQRGNALPPRPDPTSVQI